MTFSARMIFRSFSADSGVWGGENRRFAPILILEKSVSGSEILPGSDRIPAGCEKMERYSELPFFWRSSTDGFGEPPECETCRLKVKCAVDFFGKVCSHEVRFGENTLLVWRRRIRFVAGMLGRAGYRKNRSVKIYIFDSV